MRGPAGDRRPRCRAGSAPRRRQGRFLCAVAATVCPRLRGFAKTVEPCWLRALGRGDAACAYAEGPCREPRRERSPPAGRGARGAARAQDLAEARSSLARTSECLAPLVSALQRPLCRARTGEESRLRWGRAHPDAGAGDAGRSSPPIGCPGCAACCRRATSKPGSCGRRGSRRSPKAHPASPGTTHFVSARELRLRRRVAPVARQTRWIGVAHEHRPKRIASRSVADRGRASGGGRRSVVFRLRYAGLCGFRPAVRVSAFHRRDGYVHARFARRRAGRREIFRHDRRHGAGQGGSLSTTSDNQYRATVAWAFLSWRPTNDWLFRVGKQRIPLYLYSETVDVGVTYDFARLPTEMYSIIPSNELTGLSFTRIWAMDDGELSLDGYWGKGKTEIPHLDTRRHSAGAEFGCDVPGGEDIEGLGLVLSYKRSEDPLPDRREPGRRQVAGWGFSRSRQRIHSSCWLPASATIRSTRRYPVRAYRRLPVSPVRPSRSGGCRPRLRLPRH